MKKQNDIVFQRLETSVGEMLAGATERGVCLLEFADRGGLERIRKRIRKRYGLEMSERDSRFIEQLLGELAEYFEGQRREFTVPLDIKGTPFQMSVWQQLLRIPYGETRSYGDIAREIGKPGGSQAVGRANGDNCIAIVVPCHRVIEANGNLRGYGGGLERKKYLLDLEAGRASLF